MVPLTANLGTNDGTTVAPTLSGEIQVCTSKYPETMSICVNKKFPLPWSQDNGRMMMSCVTGEEDVGVKHVTLQDLDCSIGVVHDLFKLLSRLKYPPGRGLETFTMSGWKPSIDDHLWERKLNKMLPVCAQLCELSMNDMSELPRQARHTLCDFGVKVIQ